MRVKMNAVSTIMNHCHNDPSTCPLAGGVAARDETWIGLNPLPVLKYATASSGFEP
jgi:hypothetical protein